MYVRCSEVTHLSLLKQVLHSAKDISAIKTDGKDLRERNEKVIAVNLDTWLVENSSSTLGLSYTSLDSTLQRSWDTELIHTCILTYVPLHNPILHTRASLDYF